MTTITDLRFPKRFELENLDPMKLKVKVVNGFSNVKIYHNIEQASNYINFDKYHPPMACKIGNEWCIRFEA